MTFFAVLWAAANGASTSKGVAATSAPVFRKPRRVTPDLSASDMRDLLFVEFVGRVLWRRFGRHDVEAAHRFF